MGKLNSKNGFALACLALFIAGAVVFWYYPGSSSTGLRVSFLTATNDPSLGTLAVFSATNVSGYEVKFSPCETQFRTHGVWPTIPPSFLKRTETITVAPHTAASFTVPYITDSESWRVSVRWHYNEMHGLERIRGVLKVNLSINRQYYNWNDLTKGHWPVYYPNPWIESYLIYTPIITNSATGGRMPPPA